MVSGLRLSVLLVAFTLCGKSAKADFIVGLAAGANTAGVGGAPTPAGVNGKITSYSFQGADRIVTNGVNGPPADPDATTNDDFTGPGPNPNFVNISLDVFAMNAPINVTFTVQPQTSLPPPADAIGPAEYFFAVTLRNRLNDNGIQPPTDGREIGGFNVSLIPGLAGAAYDSPMNPAFGAIGGADPFPLKFGGFVTPTSLQFGGLNGGGGGLAANNSVTLLFSVDVPGSTNISPPRNFTLAFTANPEPGSLALAGMLCSVGVVYLRNRRRNAAVPVVVAK